MSETNVFTESVCLNNRQLWNVSWHVHHSAFSFPYITRVAVQSQGLFPFLSPPSWCLGHPTRGGNKPRKHSIRPKLCCGSENFRGPLNKKPERSKMKNPLQKQRLTQQALVGEGNTLPFPIATEIPQRVIKKKGSERHTDRHSELLCLNPPSVQCCILVYAMSYICIFGSVSTYTPGVAT